MPAKRPRSDSGNDYPYNELRTTCVPLELLNIELLEKARAPGVERCATHFSSLSQWAMDLLSSHYSLVDREKQAQRLLDVMQDVEFWDEELDKLTRIFLCNGYPIEVMQRNIRAVKSRWQNGDYERTVKTEKDSQNWICLPSCELTQNLQPILSRLNIQVAMKEKSTLFISLPTQHKRVDKLDCSGVTVYHAASANRNILAIQGDKLADESRNIKGSAGKWIPKDQN
ncbi:unnamed protein product [Protopolystoma xenopodis]|uniref:Uncharacterized protein n=1 Tax=Protopolystoma xenopodis TaxID=117903 RepID=A0A448XGM6_9PLAT|nr:unnamed protein product [Protopolystoma xenopodis]